MSKNYIVSSWCEGEGFTIIDSISDSAIKEIEKILKVSFENDITSEHPIEIRAITDEQLRVTEINAHVFNGHSMANAERLADGKGSLKELED